MRRAGFTLFELILVIGLIGLLSIALMPRLGGGSSKGLDYGAEIVAADLRYAAQRAIATGRAHRWVADLDGQRFRIEETRLPEGEPESEMPTHSGLLDLAPPLVEALHEPIDDKTGEWRWLDERGVLIEAVFVGDEEFGEGQAWIAFSGDGGADPARVELSDDHEYRVVLRVLPFTGEVRISDVDQP